MDSVNVLLNLKRMLPGRPPATPIHRLTAQSGGGKISENIGPKRAVIASRVANLNHGQRRPANLPLAISQSEAAAMFDVSERTIRMLKVVEREAPEYIPEIESGDIAVGKAYKLIKRDEIKARVEEIHKKRITEPDGRYDVVVIDLTQHTAMPVDFSSKQRHI